MSTPFSVTLSAEQIKRGLRPSKRAPRNSGLMAECSGMLGRDGVLAALDSLTALTVYNSTIAAFPFPQIFVLTNFILVCDSKHVYEYADGTLTLKYTPAKYGGLWCVADFYNYLYLSNGQEAVIRDANSGVYSESDTLPACTTICNYNGQVLIGNPDTLATYQSYWNGGSINITLSNRAYLSYELGFLSTEDGLYITTENDYYITVEKGIQCG